MSEKSTRDITPFPMYSYKGKFWGISLSIISLLLFITNLIFTNFDTIINVENSVINEVLLWMLGYGLFTIAFSKEKYEDERVHLIRYKSLRLSMGTMLTIIFVYGFMNTIGELDFTKKIFFLQYTSFMLGVVMYLIFFYRGLLFDSDFVYSDNTVKVNFISNKKEFIQGILISILLLILTILLTWMFG